MAPRPLTALISRILLSGIFVASGVAKFLDLEATVGYMATQGVGSRAAAIVAAIAEIAGGLSLAFGFLTRIGALGLLLFLIPTTVIFHDFWAVAGDARLMQLTLFLKNLAIMGGLGLLIAYGPGRYSFDRWMREPRPV
ncbi:MAG TPA: DoxX family protein [Kofleriaceae bacterium]|nr:DoxX family protein [Kofleriaceae bacterium]